MELTKTQLNYLMAVKRLMGGRVTLTDISECLGIKKPTASVALKKLEENGYIIKNETHDGNEYSLSRKSCIILEELERERFEFLSLFNDHLGISYKECDEEYRKLCGLFSRGFIRDLTAARENGYNGADRHRTGNGGKSFGGIEYGRYKIPFQVVQCGDGGRSMGDKGFMHPAVLVIYENRQDILLESKKIYYKSKSNQSLRGELSELCYLDKSMKWVRSKKDRENVWIIPIKNILYQKDDYGKISIGIIKIKAQATTVKMPASVAEITFNFELLEQIS
ncbi:MAG: metal-dependent transcriptional regulator [Candidatus Ornithomonoglobus sp.]